MDLFQTLSKFYESYPSLKTVIGLSEENRPIYAFFVGKEGGPVGISQAAIHGREWITALLSLEQIKRGLKGGGFWVIPLTNPDGALLSQIGLSSASEKRRGILKKLNRGEDFSLWKANIEGVDLNVNFDANWGTGKQNVFSPAPENYVGKFPLCARESLALANFTEKVKPTFTISWHTKGEELYWSFRPQKEVLGDRKLSKRFSEKISLPLKEAKFSAGGYKDWCLMKLKIPAFTAEIGSEKLKHPIGEEHLFSLTQKYGLALQALIDSFEEVYG